jgi:small subunit ribosomal protein S20
MPTTTSAKKRHRQSLENRAKNRAVKSTLKTAVRKLHEASATGGTAAKDMLPSVFKALDQAAAKGVIHPNKAARSKSRLNAKLKSAAGK